MPFAPPPPPPPGPPPPPSFPAGPGPAAAAKNPAADASSRNQLLQSIRKGAALKKTVTNDRSAPLVGGKSGGTGGSGPPSMGSPNSGSPKSIASGSATLGRNNALAGLFAGGMPKLKPTGLDIGQSNSGQSQSLTSLPVSNASTLHTKMENTRRQLSVDVKNRGPPPQPPPANQKPTMPQSASDSVLTGPMVSARSNSTTSLNNGWISSSSSSSNSGGVGGLHHHPRKAPAGGYGKPNVAPKPPGINGNSNGLVGGSGSMISLSSSSPSKPCPPPKKPVNGRSMVARAHSMRAPRSPPIAPVPTAPTYPTPATSSPTTRSNQPLELSRIGMPPPFHQSQDSLMSTPPPPKAGTLPAVLRPMPGAASRPMQRPPPPPPSRLAMSSPPCPPPPPPPNMAPPPPPHRIPSDSSLVSNSQPPPPPMRLSSMRNGISPFCGDLEARFAEMFHHPKEFPPPQPFRNLPKIYNSKSAKQQAPLPPTHIQLGSKMWSRDNTSTC